MLRTKWCILVLSVVLWTSSIESARILGLFPTPAPSHYFLGHKLLRELAVRGHDVTMVSAFGTKEPIANYRDVILEGTKDLMALVPDSEKVNFVETGKLPPWHEAIFTSHMGSGATEMALKDKALQNLLQSNETFDLVILEIFFSEVMYGVAHRFNCPLLILSTIDSTVWTNHLVGNLEPNSYVPALYQKFTSSMSFVERLENAVHNIIIDAHRQFIYFPRLDAQLREYFPDAPPLKELMYSRTALILLNAHPSLTDARPHVPNMVQIGGFHIDAPKPLPKDLKDFMDNATNGVILFSMGSNMKSKDLGNKTVNAILRSFAKLNQTVIWKWEDENLPGKPENVKIIKWCPQNDILAHPNLKLFISHGGLLSATEAVYHGVPIIGIPIFGDQKMNVATWEKNGFCIGIKYGDLSEDTLTAAMEEILGNPKYRNNAIQRSQLLRDQPIRPIDAAVYWTEYVIKYRGAEHLRTAAMDLEWYQLYSVDLLVLGIVINIVLLIFWAILLRNCLKKYDMRNANKKKN